MPTLVLLRHGETDLNARGVFQGQLDEPLNARGIEQATAVATAIAALQPTAVVSSDLQRARQTADVIAKGIGLDVAVEPRLREIDCGSWSGRAFTDILSAEPWVAEKMRAGADFRRSASGENGSEVADRMMAVLSELIAANQQGTILVVGHGFALRVGLGRFLGFDQGASSALGTMLNCHYAKLVSQDGRFRLAAYNVGS